MFWGGGGGGGLVGGVVQRATSPCTSPVRSTTRAVFRHDVAPGTWELGVAAHRRGGAPRGDASAPPPPAPFCPTVAAPYFKGLFYFMWFAPRWEQGLGSHAAHSALVLQPHPLDISARPSLRRHLSHLPAPPSNDLSPPETRLLLWQSKKGGPAGREAGSHGSKAQGVARGGGGGGALACRMNVRAGSERRRMSCQEDGQRAPKVGTGVQENEGVRRRSDGR